MEKLIEIVAGPNGSGKSTFAETYFLQTKQDSPLFINSDVIASGISPLNVDAAAFAAGRVMLEAIHDSISKNENFSFETTLAGKTWVNLLHKAKQKGYSITIYFIYLNHVRENIKRIKERTQRGGHAVPIQTVKRRYPKSIENFWHVYRPLADNWYIFNNSGKKAKLIFSKDLFSVLNEKKQKEFEKNFLSHAKKN